MTYCVWNADAYETGIYTCQNCSQRHVKIPPSQRAHYPKRLCKEPPGRCHHLGAEIRREDCTGCKGKRTQIKVFACAVHGECTLGKKLDGLACCAGCKDYQPKETP